VEYPVVTDEIFSFTRTLRSHPGYLVLINFGSKTESVNLLDSNTTSFQFPSHGTVEVMSDKFNPSEEIGRQINLEHVSLPPRQAIVIKFNPLWKF